MAEEYSVADPTQLLEASSEFANYPGVQTDASAKEFLDRFPLPVILNALQTKADVPGLEDTLVAVLESVFKTRYGASLLPQYMPFIQVGLTANSQKVKALACKTVTRLLESVNDYAVSAHLIIDNNIYFLLIDCLINGNEQVTTLATEAIAKIAGSPAGIDIVFPSDTNEATHLGKLASECSSLGRIRILALIVKLFSISPHVASVVSKSNLLRLFEAEINSNDTLSTLNVMELLYELSEIEHGRPFSSTSTLLQLLSSIISDQSMDPVLRSRAMTIGGRLLSNGNNIFSDESSAKTVVSAIDRILSSSETHDTDECESALEALGQIGSSMQGAHLLLSSSPPAARHVIYYAFDRQGHGRQLAALHALANISGETRTENSIILTNDAEESLRRLIYETASKSSKLTPSGLFLSVLQQDPETRLAGYRVLTGLGVRPWCLMEICSKQEIINIVTDAAMETTKLGMEARYNCCKTIHTAFNMSSKLSSDPALGGIAAKLHEAVRLGPYLARKHREAQPTVVTADRF
ncbi:uncharacterized protein LOC126786682 [Argentina anserina]|uniref:uncharacterized protein LOC126786682 n=1 Tax=Argentina anserina TaxID=57926 RepID=UPI0021761DBD|nr:uncharacterized protein LOC126786682 [Potentilla anserina]